jgi:hypothetical protein
MDVAGRFSLLLQPILAHCAHLEPTLSRIGQPEQMVCEEAAEEETSDDEWRRHAFVIGRWRSCITARREYRSIHFVRRPRAFGLFTSPLWPLAKHCALIAGNVTL